MRFIIYGAGAIGGAIGSGLFSSDHEVILIARGTQYLAIHEHGLRIDSPLGSTTYPIPVIARPSDLSYRSDDVVVLTVKSQDTLSVISELSQVASVSTSVVCAQNGVENERVALRFFEHVYGVCVVGVTANVEPGVVKVESAPIFGSLDIGRFPHGSDDRSAMISSALSNSWVVASRDQVMEWKYTKLLRNLVLSIQALCGVGARQGTFFDMVLAEGQACLRAANIAYVDADAWNRARADAPKVDRPFWGNSVGGSSWQSLARGTGSIETAYLNGEILLLARQYGVATPANALLYELSVQAATTGQQPGTMTEEELLGLLKTR